MNPLKILLISYSFPPLGGVGVMRAASLARYLPAENIQLDVITARNASAVGTDTDLLREIPNDVAVHRTLTLDVPFGIRKRIKRLLASSSATPPQETSALDGTGPGLLTRVAQKVLRPDPQVTWLPILSRVAPRVIANRDIDIALITAPPFSSLMLVDKLRKRFPSLPIVVDFRDEWIATTFDLVSFVFNSGEEQRVFASNVECGAIRSATAVVAVTQAASQKIRLRYPDQPDSKFHVIPNGYDATRVQHAESVPDRKHDSRIIVTYVGTVYASTEPKALVDALQSLPTDLKSRFRFCFIGHIEEPEFRDALLRLGDLVELKGYLPQQEALTAMNETDYVLLINHDPINVGGKFYDYIGSGKPIIGAVHPDGETRHLLEELRAGWWASNDDVPAIRQLFLDAAARGKYPFASFQPDTGKIAQYERKVLAQRYAALLHSIAGRVRQPESESQPSRADA
jgi:glycosyltransferase involved in cell wall biosynthesis